MPPPKRKRRRKRKTAPTHTRQIGLEKPGRKQVRRTSARERSAGTTPKDAAALWLRSDPEWEKKALAEAARRKANVSDRMDRKRRNGRA